MYIPQVWNISGSHMLPGSTVRVERLLCHCLNRYSRLCRSFQVCYNTWRILLFIKFTAVSLWANSSAAIWLRKVCKNVMWNKSQTSKLHSRSLFSSGFHVRGLITDAVFLCVPLKQLCKGLRIPLNVCWLRKQEGRQALGSLVAWWGRL